MLSYLGDLFDYSFFKWLGAIYFLRLVILNMVQIYRGFMIYVWSYFASPRDFVKDYGEWAVVTGGSDGIGKQMAFELAAKGMNIFILSNVENDLKTVSSDIEAKYGVKSKWQCVDFSDLSCYDEIKPNLDQISDIGILVNNVGIINENLETVPRQPETLIKKMICINSIAGTMMSRIIVPKMMDKKKGLILNVGSKAALNAVPRSSIYCATKVFVRKLSECLVQEVQGHGVQVSCVEPYFVGTGLMLRNSKSRAIVNALPSFMVPTPAVFAKNVVQVLNVDVPLFFSGYWVHGLASYIINALGGNTIETVFKTSFARSNSRKKVS